MTPPVYGMCFMYTSNYLALSTVPKIHLGLLCDSRPMTHYTHATMLSAPRKGALASALNAMTPGSSTKTQGLSSKAPSYPFTASGRASHNVIKEKSWKHLTWIVLLQPTLVQREAVGHISMQYVDQMQHTHSGPLRKITEPDISDFKKLNKTI